MAEIENKVAPSEAKAPAQDNKFAPRGNRNAHGNSNNRGGRPNGGRRFNGRRDEIEYEEKIVKISKVSKTVKGGKRMRFTALSVIGDKKGKYGFGLGKSTEVPEAIKKSLASSKRNMFHVAVSKGDTIAHTVIGKFGATSVFLKPAPEGTGLVAGGAVRAILELAGVRNVYS
ncbi:MAG: 30S ribosomal protein S5, partial [Bacilli bacterium]